MQLDLIDLCYVSATLTLSNQFILPTFTIQCSVESFPGVKVFTVQKKTVRIIVGAKPRNSCRGLFKRLDIH
jgi:hypothetical protein